MNETQTKKEQRFERPANANRKYKKQNTEKAPVQVGGSLRNENTVGVTQHNSQNKETCLIPTPPSLDQREGISELNSIARGCSMKALGCSWASKRMRLKEMDADHRSEIAPKDAAIVEEAKKHQVWVWMNCSTAPVPDSPDEYDTLASCFEELAASIDLVSLIEAFETENSPLLRQAWCLMAEAQSMVRTCVQRIEGPTDNDQLAAFKWLHRRAKEASFLIDRYMRLDDPADPEDVRRLKADVSKATKRARQVRSVKTTERKLLNKLAYKLNDLNSTDSNQDQINGIEQTVNELIKNGLPPSSTRLRNLLLPHFIELNQLHEKMHSKGMRMILRELAQHTAVKNDLPASPKARQFSTEVAEVKKLLKGRRIAPIGGACQPESKRAIEKEFGLAELIWIETKPHQSYHDFRPIVERTDIVVVGLLIRWVSHSFSEIRHYCRDSGTAFVKLPGGYNANQLAEKILSQCSKQLKAKFGR